LFWALNGLNELLEMLFEFLFNLIGKLTMALLTGQSWYILKSCYTGGSPEQEFQHCFVDGLILQSSTPFQVQAVGQITIKRNRLFLGIFANNPSLS